MPCCTPGRRKVWVSLPKSPFILTSFCLAPFGNENGLKCRLKVSYCTLGRRKSAKVSPKSAALHSRATKSVGFVAEESVYPYVILPYTHGQQKCTEVSPERVVPHSWATKMDRSVTQACRAAPSSDKKVRNCCPSVSCFTLGRRKVWVSLPKSPFILTSFCLAPFGNENGLKCRLKVSYCTLGRRKSAKVSPKSAALHSRATKSVGFVAEESLHPYVILPCTFRQRKWAEVSPESVVLHSWATKMYGSVAQACRTLLSSNEKYGFRCRRVPFILTSFCPTPTGDENVRKCRLNVSCRTLGRRRSAEVSLKRVVPHSWATKKR